MDLFLLLKDTLNVIVMCDSLSAGKVYLTNDTVTVCKTCLGCAKYCVNNAVLITATICVTLILITSVIVGLVLYHRRKLVWIKYAMEKERIEVESRQRESKNNLRTEEEQNRYKERLLNYLENNGRGDEYKEKLESFINDSPQITHMR